MDDCDLLATIDNAIMESWEIPTYPRWNIYYFGNDEDLEETDDYWFMDGDKETLQKVYKKCWEIVKNVDVSYLQYSRIVLVVELDEDNSDELVDLWNKQRDIKKVIKKRKLKIIN